MPHRDAAQRVRDRILDWMKREGHGSKTRLAEAVSAPFGTNKSQSWATSIQHAPDNDGQDVRLKDLDAVAECLGLLPGELVSTYDRKYLELTMAEARLVEHYRKLPDPMKAHWMHLFDHLFQFYPSTDSSSDRQKSRRQPRNKPRTRTA